MEKRRGKKKEIILGFDETNNGFHLKSDFSDRDVPLILTGYMAEDLKRANYGSVKYESSKGIVNGKKKNQIGIRSQYYLPLHPEFLYTTISKDMLKFQELAMLKAKAIAAITFSFFLHNELNPSSTKVMIDNMDYHSNDVMHHLDSLFLNANLKIPHKCKKKADKKVVAVRKAHAVGRFLSSLYLNGQTQRLPYIKNRVWMGSLEELSVEIKRKNYPVHPEYRIIADGKGTKEKKVLYVGYDESGNGQKKSICVATFSHLEADSRPELFRRKRDRSLLNKLDSPERDFRFSIFDKDYFKGKTKDSNNNSYMSHILPRLIKSFVGPAGDYDKLSICIDGEISSKDEKLVRHSLSNFPLRIDCDAFSKSVTNGTYTQPLITSLADSKSYFLRKEYGNNIKNLEELPEFVGFEE